MEETRTLPALAAGPVEMPFAIMCWSEDFDRDVTWNEHSHPFHELLWNERGASTAGVGPRVWTITPALGLWMPAGTLHSGAAAAGTRCRATFFGFDAVSPISATPVAVEITPLLRLLLERLAEPGLPAGSRAVTEAMVLDVLTPSEHVQRRDRYQFRAVGRDRAGPARGGAAEPRLGDRGGGGGGRLPLRQRVRRGVPAGDRADPGDVPGAVSRDSVRGSVLARVSRSR